MEKILSILVFLGVLFLYVPYTTEYIDYQIQTHQQEIDQVQNDPHKMSQVTMYKVKNDNLGRVVIVDREDIE